MTITPPAVVPAPTVAFPLTEEGLTAALEALGDTRTAVADTLRAGGYLGRFGCPGACPVAVYLRQTFGRDAVAAVRVFDDVIMVRTVVVEYLFDVMTTPAVQQFILAGDIGQYPDLELAEEG